MADKYVSVAALMTAPRHEIVWARTQIERALNTLRIPLRVSGGVFYGQCMQRMLSDLVNKDVDYALTVDFDSVFVAADVQRLLDVIASDPDIDAVAALQPKRGNGAVLGTRGQQESFLSDGSPFQVATAHFGLTVIDLAKLRQVEKPWFCTVPDEQGEYSASKIDDDVFFWRRWTAEGNTIWIDPSCRLGHLEEMVTMFDETGQLKHYYPREWVEMKKDASGIDPPLADAKGGACVPVDAADISQVSDPTENCCGGVC